MLYELLECNTMNHENSNIGYCLTKKESKQDVLDRLSDSIKYVKQADHMFPEKIISDIRFWLNESIDRFEELPEREKIKLMDDVTQLKLTIYMVEQWFENQIGSEIKLEDEIAKEPEINPTNPSLTFKS